MPENKENSDIDFNDLAVAEKYDNVLVPAMFEPWAEKLLERLNLKDGMAVLDLACGTGIVMRKLEEQLGNPERIVGADINPAMLAQAKKYTYDSRNTEFAVASAESLELQDSTFDYVICQQAFQFFPDCNAVATEIKRVLRPGGCVAIATWCELDRCEVFKTIQQALAAAGCDEAANQIAGPFNFMPKETLKTHFSKAGFLDVVIEEVEDELVIPGGLEGFMEFFYATPMSALLQNKSEEEIQLLRQEIEKAIAPMQYNDTTVGKMVSNFLFAHKES